jgi:hypothetical protein
LLIHYPPDFTPYACRSSASGGQETPTLTSERDAAVLVAGLTQNFHPVATLFLNDSIGFVKTLSSLRLLSK